MNDTVKAALVVLLVFLLRLAFQAIGWQVDDAVLNALAIAIVAWLLKEPAANALFATGRRLRGE